MIGYKLTPTQAAQISGKHFNSSSIFNPAPDINGDYFIFEGEVNDCTNEDYLWVKELTPSEYVPPINNEL